MTTLRIGCGIDVHRFERGKKLILGGCSIPCERGLEGHSDADVVVHAVIDALLGAAGEGDIGEHFPPGDPKYRGISSLELLEQVSQILAGNGFSVENIDVTIMLETPSLRGYKEEMVENISQHVNICSERVNVKATTFEGLGFVGQEKGAAAEAVALLRRRENG